MVQIQSSWSSSHPCSLERKEIWTVLSDYRILGNGNTMWPWLGLGKLHVRPPQVTLNVKFLLLSLFLSLTLLRKWFEPRSNIPWLKKIIWVIGVLRRTVVSDWRFDNLCEGHLQSKEDDWLKIDSEDGFRTGCRKVSTNNSKSLDSNHPDDLFQSRY